MHPTLKEKAARLTNLIKNEMGDDHECMVASTFVAGVFAERAGVELTSPLSLDTAIGVMMAGQLTERGVL